VVKLKRQRDGLLLRSSLFRVGAVDIDIEGITSGGSLAAHSYFFQVHST